VKEKIQQLIQDLHHIDNSKQLAATEEIVFYGEEAISYLLEALHDPVNDAWEYAARALGKIGKEAVPGLIDSFHHNNIIIRWLCGKALLEIGEPALPKLIEIVNKDKEDKHIRAHAGQILVSINKTATPRKFILWLINSLVDDDLDDLARYSLTKIGELAIEEIFSVYKKTRNRRLFYRIKSLLIQIGEPAIGNLRQSAIAGNGNVKNSSQDILLVIDPEYRANQIRLQKEIQLSPMYMMINDQKDGRSPEEKVIEIVKASNLANTTERIKLMEILGEEKPEKAMPVFLFLLEDTNPSIRATSVRMLGNIANASEIKKLCKKIFDTSNDVRLNAIRVVIKLTSSTLIKTLKSIVSIVINAILNDRTPKKLDETNVLEKHQDNYDINDQEVLLYLINNNHPRYKEGLWALAEKKRKIATSLLEKKKKYGDKFDVIFHYHSSQIDNDKLIPALLRLLVDEEIKYSFGWHSALDILKNTPETMKIILDGLGRKDNNEDNMAMVLMEILKNVHSDELFFGEVIQAFFNKLIKLLDSPNPLIRESCLCALLKLGGKQILEALLLATKDESPTIRVLALEGLNNQKGDDIKIITPALNALSDPNFDVKRQAMYNLKDYFSHALLVAERKNFKEHKNKLFASLGIDENHLLKLLIGLLDNEIGSGLERSDDSPQNRQLSLRLDHYDTIANRTSIINLLGTLGNPLAISKLSEAMAMKVEDYHDEEYHATVIRALTMMDTPEAVKILESHGFL